MLVDIFKSNGVLFGGLGSLWHTSVSLCKNASVPRLNYRLFPSFCSYNLYNYYKDGKVCSTRNRAKEKGLNRGTMSAYEAFHAFRI